MGRRQMEGKGRDWVLKAMNSMYNSIGKLGGLAVAALTWMSANLFWWAMKASSAFRLSRFRVGRGRSGQL